MFGNKVCCLFLFIVVGGVLDAAESAALPDAVPAVATTFKSFRDVCYGNGEFYENKQVTSVMIMGAENERKLYISIDNNPNIVASKDYESGKISDKFLIEGVIKANLLKSVVDLCITGNAKELYGIHLK